MHHCPEHLELPFCAFITAMEVMLCVLKSQLLQQFPNTDSQPFHVSAGQGPDEQLA